jgi:hypothetical protein
MKDNGTIGPADPLNRFETYPQHGLAGGPHVFNKDDQRSYSYGAGIWIGGKRNDIFFSLKMVRLLLLIKVLFEPIQ